MKLPGLSCPATAGFWAPAPMGACGRVLGACPPVPQTPVPRGASHGGTMTCAVSSVGVFGSVAGLPKPM